MYRSSICLATAGSASRYCTGGSSFSLSLSFIALFLVNLCMDQLAPIARVGIEAGREGVVDTAVAVATLREDPSDLQPQLWSWTVREVAGPQRRATAVSRLESQSRVLGRSAGKGSSGRSRQGTADPGPRRRGPTRSCCHRPSKDGGGGGIVRLQIPRAIQGFFNSRGGI